ncbi:hypothetical protein [Clostridium sp. 29_15]|uniref:hypothetical protein n=1 Tax=Clostridium sp. 29_15 TaxID=1896982 RepID=UPI00095D3688|nr:hypothetical protein [Clostridium sp. 29_15]OKZ87692.1 MAG: hypothetical protein BHW04_04685 [Clostridium sp. 29_15]
MKKKFIIFLIIVSIFTLVSCSNETNKSESSIDKTVEDNSVSADKEVSQKEENKEEKNKEEVNNESKENVEENKIDSNSIDDNINEKEKKYNDKYNIIKDLIENKKMTIKNSNYREIEAENGLGENIVYKLNENNKIVISSSVRLTTILNDGKYDISGSIFSNILIEVLNDSKYIKDINEAIGNYFTEEKDIYTKDINELKIDVSQEFDFIKITVTV